MTAVNGMNTTQSASADAMSMMDSATANIIRQQATQNVATAEADASTANAQQVGQSLAKASSV